MLIKTANLLTGPSSGMLYDQRNRQLLAKKSETDNTTGALRHFLGQWKKEPFPSNTYQQLFRSNALRTFI